MKLDEFEEVPEAAYHSFSAPAGPNWLFFPSTDRGFGDIGQFPKGQYIWP